MLFRSILNFEHWLSIAKFIRAQIDEFDKTLNPESDGDEVEAFGRIHLGAKQKCLSMAEVEQITDIAFTNFRTRFSKFINNFLPAHGIARPDDKPITIKEMMWYYLLFK